MKKKPKSATRRIIVLNPFPTKAQSKTAKPEKKLRVAAYCRVSSSSDEQLVSYQNQVQHYQSDNVKWGIRRQYERGNIKSVQASKFLGYKKDKQGDLVINEEQAVTVHRIYQLFLDGLGVYQIAKLLTVENVPMAYGGKEWTPSHILKVLTNEKYMGDTRFQKTFNADYLTKRRVRNTGQLPQYYRENTHPAIID